MNRSVYLYPITYYDLKTGTNNYIFKIKSALSEEYQVVNGPTRLGILDLMIKLPRVQVLYFNWVTDLADKRFGYLQLLLLFLILVYAKLSRKKIIWFVHNNVSHYKKNWRVKKLVRRMMMAFADKILSHSKEADLKTKKQIEVFDHPVEEFAPVTTSSEPVYDLLIWGTVTPYKGVLELLRFMTSTGKLKNYRILIAGRFRSEELYQAVQKISVKNVTIVNKVISESALPAYFENSRYVLFCYNSSSVLSSGALSKTLAYGKTIIGPDRGSFRELAQKGLIVSYRDFYELEEKLAEMKATKFSVDQELIRNYAADMSWQNFGVFLRQQVKDEKISSNQEPAFGSTRTTPPEGLHQPSMTVHIAHTQDH